MTSSKLRKKFRNFLSKPQDNTFAVNNMPLAPETNAVETIKVPKLSSNSKEILVGDKFRLNIKNRTQNSVYKWKSSNNSVAIVNKNGLVKGIGTGKAVIICNVKTPKEMYKLSCDVTVRIPEKPVADYVGSDTGILIETDTEEADINGYEYAESDENTEIIECSVNADDTVIIENKETFVSPAGGEATEKTTPTIMICNPGNVFCGIPVTMKADRTDVVWSVYGYIDDSNGYAVIDAISGILNPIEAGTVRVVAASMTNSDVYGAVDIVIQSKRFVKIMPPDDIYLNSDEALSGIRELEKCGKLPAKVTLVYETGDGNETENIELQLPACRWTGNYNGIQTGTYLVKKFISAPSGYEQPEDLYVDVAVHVNVPQSDKRLYITGVDEIMPIELSTDEHCVSTGSIFSKYFYYHPVTLHLSDGSGKTANVTGYSVDNERSFSGAVPGTYKINLTAGLEAGLVFKDITRFTEDYVHWTDYDYINVTASVNVSAVQTPANHAGISDRTIPAATQEKFIPEKKNVIIESVVLEGVPATIYLGNVLDLNKYVTVKTTSGMPSDHRVVWSVNGNTDSENFIISNGRAVINRAGSFIIRATSATDPSKYSETTVFIPDEAITGFVPFNEIDVTEDRGIVDFKTLYNALIKELPATVTATTVSGNRIIQITGWRLKKSDTDSYVLIPKLDTLLDYNYNQLPELKVKVSTFQTDKRIAVIDIKPVQDSFIIEEDKNATTVFYLMNVLYKYPLVTKIPVSATLVNGKKVTFDCDIESYRIYDPENYLLYRGKPGSYVINLGLSLPGKYVYSRNDTVSIQIPLTLKTVQTPRYDNIWVSREPEKMTYTVGDKFDFSGIIIMLKNATAGKRNSGYIYISSDQLSDYNLKFYIYDSSRFEIDIVKLPLTKDMNGRYIYVCDPSNNTYTFFGPVTVNDYKIYNYKYGRHN